MSDESQSFMFQSRWKACQCQRFELCPTKWSSTLKQFAGKLLTNCLNMFDHFVGLIFFSIKQNHQIHGKANFYFLKDKIVILITHKFFSKIKYISPGYIAQTERRWDIQKTSRTPCKGLYYFNLRVLSRKIGTTNPCGG